MPGRPVPPAATQTASVRQRADFAGELVRWRLKAQLSQADLGERMGYNRTYINKIERGALDPTAGFAKKADEAFGLQGDLYALWRRFDATRATSPDRRRRPPSANELSAEVEVHHDEAWLRRRNDSYELHMRKVLANVGETPILRYFMRVAVDRFPHDPRRSSAFYRANPLTVEELDLRASCGDEAMEYQIAQDHDSSKDIWLLFKNGACEFPLYPGKEATVDYTFRASATKWGDFFQRSIRLPTRRVSVHLRFPLAFETAVWGVETSPSASHQPFPSPIETSTWGDEACFDWSAHRPPIGARYRLQWRFSPSVDKEIQ